MASTGPDGAPSDGSGVERFARNGGTVVTVLGGLVLAAFLVAWALDPDDVPLWVPAAALLGGVLLWTSTIRPRVQVEGRELVLRNMLSDVRLPLATIEEVAVRQVLAVRAGDKRYVCSGTGRSLRTVVKSSIRQSFGDPTPSEVIATGIEPGMDYGDYVEMRIRELANADRARRGASSPYAPEVEALYPQIRRVWARPELALLGATAVLFGLGILIAL